MNLDFVISPFGTIPEQRVNKKELEKYTQKYQVELVEWEKIKYLYLFGKKADEKRPSGDDRLTPGIYVDHSGEGALIVDADDVQSGMTHCMDSLERLTIWFFDFDDHMLCDVLLPTSLKRLDLSNTNLKSLNGVKLPSSIEQLNLSNTKVNTLNGVELPANLEWLLLSYSELKSLSAVQLPRNLQMLSLCSTEIESLDGVALPSGLQSLDLSGTYISSLRGVKMPVSLESLDLTDTKLESLEGVLLPESLEELSLGGTSVTNLTDVEFPSNLQSLDLSASNISSLNGVMLPANLEELILCATKLADVNGVKLPHCLEILDLSYTDLEGLDGVWFPPFLQELTLGHTSIKKLPDSLQSLMYLEALDLSGMRLEDIPDWLAGFGLPFSRKKYSSGICLYDVSVQGVDMSIFDQSQEAILQWFEERKQAKEAKPLNEVKVVFLGDGGAGKSHTIARLLNDGGQTEDFPNISTPGIVITDKTYPIGDREVKVHYWDFGGQEILHSMHRMFLTKRTLYVVMVNVRDGNQDERARYWLHNLKSFADGAPVLLVLNQMDMNKNASVNEEDLRKLYPGLTEKVVKLSTLTYSDKEFQKEFIDVLVKQIGNMEILDLPLVAAGRRVKERLQTMTESYIHGDVFRQFCDDCGVTGTDAVRRDLLEQFGQLGVSFCYSDSMELKDHVVLKPAWITNAIYIILFNKVEAVNNGLVSHDTIYRMLTSEDTEHIRRAVTDATYTRQEVDYVLKVFRKFRLSFMVEDENTEFLPMLCDAKTTAEAAKYEDADDALEFRMHYAFLPPNVIHRLMVERRKELDRDNVWLTGARFVCGDTGRSAVVKSEGNLIRILVRAEGDLRDPQRYLDELKESLERINEIMGLTVESMEVVYKENGKTACFDYADLMFAQDMGETQILCRELRKRIRLVDVLMQSDFPEDEKQKKLMADIRQACEMLHEDSLYWKANEDQRTGLLAKLLRAKDYIAMEQHRTGISAGGIQSGELDLDIRLTPGDAWSALEALNLKGSSPGQIEYWNAHLKKLLDNYNDVGRSFLFHVSYVQCPKDKFGKIMSDMYEHMRFYSPRGFELLRRFVSPVPLGNEREQNQFLRAVKCVYDCGGVVMTVYHFFVRIGE